MPDTPHARPPARTHRIEDLEVTLCLFARTDRDRLERPPHTLAFPSLRLGVPHFVESGTEGRGGGVEGGQGRIKEGREGYRKHQQQMFEVNTRVMFAQCRVTGAAIKNTARGKRGGRAEGTQQTGLL